jgi:hypothetical protein
MAATISDDPRFEMIATEYTASRLSRGYGPLQMKDV